MYFRENKANLHFIIRVCNHRKSIENATIFRVSSTDVIVPLTDRLACCHGMDVTPFGAEVEGHVAGLWAVAEDLSPVDTPLPGVLERPCLQSVRLAS